MALFASGCGAPAQQNCLRAGDLIVEPDICTGSKDAAKDLVMPEREAEGKLERGLTGAEGA